MKQLAFDLPYREARGRQDFLVAPSNALAVEMIDRWPDWPGPVLALVGDSGAGKTHLASVWQQTSQASWLKGPRIDMEEVVDHPPDSAFVLDDVEGDLDEEGLFHLLNWLKGNGGSLLIASRQAPARWSVQLPDLRSRLATVPTLGLDAPDDQLLSAVLVKLFNDRQLRIDPEVISYMVPRMQRSFAAAGALVDRLDRESLRLNRRINKALAVQMFNEQPGLFQDGASS